jgi:hypothetical protein
MNYPEDPPERLRTHIEAAIAQAEIDLVKIRKKYGLTLENHWQGAIVVWVRTIFFAFGKQACLMVENGVWNSEKARDEIDGYLRMLARTGYLKLAPKSLQLPRTVKEAVDEIMASVTSLDEWAELQGNLKRLAEILANGLYDDLELVTETEVVGPVVPNEEQITDNYEEIKSTEGGKVKTPPRTYEANLKLLKPGITLNRITAAESIGVSVRTLDRMVKDGRLTPTGHGYRKRFKTNDLMAIADQRMRDKRDTN